MPDVPPVQKYADRCTPLSKRRKRLAASVRWSSAMNDGRLAAEGGTDRRNMRKDTTTGTRTGRGTGRID
jgi:hypothetical protein